MSKPLVSVPLTLAAAFAFHVAMSPPTRAAPLTAPPKDARRHTQICAIARIVTTLTTKGIYWAATLADVLVLLVPHLRPPRASLLAWIPSPNLTAFRSFSLPISLLSFALPTLPSMPLAATVGTTLALAGASLRRSAYDALGQFYACPHSHSGACTHHAHALITTGPYAFVRHPGYAGLVLSTAGLVLNTCGAPRATGGLGRVSAAMRTVALVCAVLGTVGALWRMQDEERALKARFKGEWEGWALRVRYRLVPGVY